MITYSGTNTNSGMRTAASCEIERLREQNAKLEAENTRLRAMDDRAHKLIEYWADRARKSEAENSRLREEKAEIDLELFKWKNKVRPMQLAIDRLEREKEELLRFMEHQRDYAQKVIDAWEDADRQVYDPVPLDIAYSVRNWANTALAKGGE